ncbi:MAG TPA: hypothetical protein VGS80_09275, partial [Ktedonobacterales bacterium]|nr:hypothetical protein [Ktedonobacterales bacterium]
RDASIDGLYVHGASLYVSLSFRQSCPTTCMMARQTSDNGMSWSAFTPIVRGYPVYLLGTSVDARTLFGHYFESDGPPGGAYVLSGDGGATWRTVPAFPGAQVADRILAAPDGTIFAEVEPSPSPPAGASSSPPGVYKFLLAASAWVFVASYPGNPSGPIMLAWGGGHPVALWGGAHQQLYPDGLRAGMEEHRP